MYLLDQFITHGWPDPITGKAVPLPLQAIAIEEKLVSHLKERITTLSLGESYAVISDNNTYELLGKKVEQALADNTDPKKVVSVVLKNPEADEMRVDLVRKATVGQDVLIAVGSGTINDICKYASFLDKKPYIVWGTALSMNGYSSANAAIMLKGHKYSLAAQLPAAIFLDLDVLLEAPLRLLKSGVGDIICRSTAQADWLLSHLLLDTPYLEAPFRWLKPYEELLYGHIAALLQGDRELLHVLSHMIVLSGLGMVYTGGSYPASQGEHLIAHLMEMVSKPGGRHSYHGEQIGVTTCTMSALQAYMLQEIPQLSPLEIDIAGMVDFLGQEVTISCLEEYRKKQLSVKKIEHVNHRLQDKWSIIVEQITKVMRSPAEIHESLCQLQAPAYPYELGWQEDIYKKAVRYAAVIRNRFSFLDLAIMSRKMSCFLMD